MAPNHKVQNSLKDAKPSPKKYQTKKNAFTQCKVEDGSTGKQIAGRNIEQNRVKSKTFVRFKTKNLKPGISDDTQKTTKSEFTYL